MPRIRRVAHAVGAALVAVAAFPLIGRGPALADDDDRGARKAALVAYDARKTIAGKPRPTGEALIDAWEEEQSHARRTFAEAFAKTNWDAWALPDDSDVLCDGLKCFAECACEDRKWDDARRAYETCIKRLPEEPFSYEVRWRRLPTVMISSGDIEGARAKLVELERESEEETVAHSVTPAMNHLALGDLQFVLGDAKAATAAHNAAEAAFATWNGFKRPIEPDLWEAKDLFPFEVGLRRRCLGKSTAELHTSLWVGMPTLDWPRLAGKIVVIYLCGATTWTRDGEFEWLEKFAKDNASLPIQVLLVLHPGGLPGFTASPGHNAREFVTKKRAERKLSLPCAVLEDADFSAWTGTSFRSALLVAGDKKKFVCAGTELVGFDRTLGIALALAKKIAPAPAPSTDGSTPPK